MTIFLDRECCHPSPTIVNAFGIPLEIGDRVGRKVLVNLQSVG
jgi:hypothetical protein